MSVRAALSALGLAAAGLLLGRSTPEPATHRAAARPLGRTVATRKPDKPRAATARRTSPHHRGVESAAEFLGKRSLHPGHSSSLRKLQRAFRIAGQSFTPESAGKGRGR